MDGSHLRSATTGELESDAAARVDGVADGVDMAQGTHTQHSRV